MKHRWSPPETWWCVEVDGPAGAARQIGSMRAWQDVLDRAAAIRRLGDIGVPGYTGLFRVRSRRDADRFYLVCERPGTRRTSIGWGDRPRFHVEPGPPLG